MKARYFKKTIVYTILLSIIFFVFSALNAFTTRIDPDEYIIKTGDTFFIQTSILDTLTVRSRVLPAGSINLFPFADSVNVAGKTLTEAYRAIHSKIGNDIHSNRILIQLAAIAPIRYNVLGAITRPGEYTSGTLITLQQAIHLSGGLSSTASRRIRILRNGNLLEYDLNDYYANNDLKGNPLIMHDDMIMVNLAENFVRVYTHMDTNNMIEFLELGDGSSTIAELLPKLIVKYYISNLEVFTVERNGIYHTVDKNFELFAHDKLFIASEDTFVYVHGYVVRPGRVAYNGGFDADFYIAQSGGLSPNASRSKIYIVKKSGEREIYTNQHIDPGDSFYIPESFRSMAVSWLVPLSTITSLISTIVIISINLK